MKEWWGFDDAGGGLGGQVPRLYGGTIFGGVCDTLGRSSRVFKMKVLIFDTFVAA